MENYKSGAIRLIHRARNMCGVRRASASGCRSRPDTGLDLLDLQEDSRREIYLKELYTQKFDIYIAWSFSLRAGPLGFVMLSLKTLLTYAHIFPACDFLRSGFSFSPQAHVAFACVEILISDFSSALGYYLLCLDQPIEYIVSC